MSLGFRILVDNFRFFPLIENTGLGVLIAKLWVRYFSKMIHKYSDSCNYEHSSPPELYSCSVLPGFLPVFFVFSLSRLFSLCFSAVFPLVSFAKIS